RTKLRPGLHTEHCEPPTPPRFVDAEEAPATPVEPLPPGADRRLETGRYADGVGDAQRDRVLEPQQLLGALGRDRAARDSGSESGRLSHAFGRSPRYRITRFRPAPFARYNPSSPARITRVG